VAVASPLVQPLARVGRWWGWRSPPTPGAGWACGAWSWPSPT